MNFYIIIMADTFHPFNRKYDARYWCLLDLGRIGTASSGSHCLPFSKIVINIPEQVPSTPLKKFANKFLNFEQKLEQIIVTHSKFNIRLLSSFPLFCSTLKNSFQRQFIPNYMYFSKKINFSF